MPSLDLTGALIEQTYQRVVQYSNGNLYDGLGNFIANIGTGNSDILTYENYVPKEKIIPDGITTTYNLSHTPFVGTEHVFVNGLLNSDEDDYTITGVSITFISTPLITDKIIVSYFKTS